MQPSRLADDAVEAVAMQYQHALALGGDVNQFIPYPDACEVQPDELAERLVMVAWNEDHPGSRIGFFEDGLHHSVVALVPIPAPLQGPAVDDVANQVKGLRV